MGVFFWGSLGYAEVVVNISSDDTTQSTSTWSGGITDTIITKTGAGRFIANVNTNWYSTNNTFQTLTIQEGTWQLYCDRSEQTNKFSYGTLIVGPQGTLELNQWNYPLGGTGVTLTVNGGNVKNVNTGTNLCPIYTLNLNGGTFSSNQSPNNGCFTLAGKVTVTKDASFDCFKVTMRTGGGATDAGTFDVQGNSVLTMNTALNLDDPGKTNAIHAVKTGTGTMILAKASTGIETGSSFTLSQGTLEIQNASALNTADIVLNGGTLKTQIGADVTLNNTITSSADKVSTLNTTSHDLTVGAITGAGTIVKTGSGTLKATSFANDLSLNIQEGTVDIPAGTDFTTLKLLGGTAKFILTGDSYAAVSADKLQLAPGSVVEMDLTGYTGAGNTTLFTANEGLYTLSLSAARMPEMSDALQHYFFNMRAVATGVYAFDVNPAAVPEPTAVILFLGCLLLLFRRKSAKYTGYR